MIFIKRSLFKNKIVISGTPVELLEQLEDLNDYIIKTVSRENDINEERIRTYLVSRLLK